MNRVLSVWLRNWPVHRLVVERPELSNQPIVLHARDSRQRQMVVGCSSRARSLGVRIDMPLADATVLVAGQAFEVQPHDPEADDEALQQLAVWASQFSPTVAVDRPDGLLMDLDGVTHLYGDEEQLADQVLKQFHDCGYRPRLAIADTTAAAWAAARYGDATVTIVPPAQPDALLEFPIAALRVDDAVLKKLDRLGIYRIGQLIKLPRKRLPSRIGTEVLQRLDLLIGARHEPVCGHQPQPRFEQQWHLDQPTKHSETIRHVVDVLLQRLAGQLQHHGRGAMQLAIRIDGVPPQEVSEMSSDLSRSELSQSEVSRLGASPGSGRSVRNLSGKALAAGEKREKVQQIPPTASALSLTPSDPPTLSSKRSQRSWECAIGFYRPSADADQFTRLAEMRLENARLPDDVQCVTVIADRVQSLEQQQRSLLELENVIDEGELAELIERLASRMGADRAVRAILVDDWQPEQAFRLEPLTKTGSSSLAGGGRAGTAAGPALNVPAVRALAPETATRIQHPGMAPKRLAKSGDGQSANRHAVAMALDPIGCDSRPLRMLFPPEPIEVEAAGTAAEAEPLRFYYCGEQIVADCRGPERIETAWWRGDCVKRDYYRVETESAARFWLFRQLDSGEWFLHGCFS